MSANPADAPRNDARGYPANPLIVHVVEYAGHVLGPEAGARWLVLPCPGLEGQVPLLLANEEAGADRVLGYLTDRLEQRLRRSDAR